jgi:diguanylate cyclase (GGDEF)-like protein
VAAVNLAQPEGGFQVVSVDGPEHVRRELIGTTSTEAEWFEMFAKAERRGGVYFVDHNQDISTTMFTWVPDIPVPADATGWHPLDCLFAPLTAPTGEWVGVLSVDLPHDGLRPGPIQRELLEMFAEHAAIAIRHAQLHRALGDSQAQLMHAAAHDPLTGLGNRTHLRSAIENLPTGTDVGVLVIDLDDFKEINDTAGHDAGDEVLRVVAERMRRLTRDGDILARTGGDEFIVVRPGGDVHATAAALRVAITEPIGVHRVGVSIGTACGPAAEAFARVIACADADMYREKAEHQRSEAGGGALGDPLCTRRGRGNLAVGSIATR